MKVIRLLSMFGILLSLAACDNRPTSPIPAEHAAPAENALARPASKVTVALIMKAAGNPFFEEMERGARQAQQEHDIDLVSRTTDQETSIEQQIQLVEDEIHDHVNALVIAPVDSRRLVPVLKDAQDAGIKIVNIDNRLDATTMKERGMAAIPFISVDNERAAYLSAKYVADKVREPAEAAIFEGIRHADNANDRKRGAERAFSENPNLTIAFRETANWSADEAYAIAKRLLPAHPRVKILFCANDMMAIGVIKYLKEVKRHDIQIASFDNVNEARDAIRQGQLAATVDQQARKQGHEGIVTALKILRGEPVPNVINLDAALVTAESIRQK